MNIHTDTADEYLREAIECVTERLGGAAKDHPQIIAAFMQAAALDYLTDKISERMLTLAENVRSDHPLMGEMFRDISASLDGIASAIEAARDK